MPSSAGPNTAGDSNLVFAYDLGDVVNSYKGEPTTNEYGSNFRDFTGTGYSPNGEWTSDPTQFTKTYYPNLPTPIGPGATLIEESGVSGFHHLSRYGGGDESGAHTLSCYLFPQSTGITEFCIGLLGDGGNMIIFNLDTRQVTYGGGIANGNAIIQDVPGWPGWIRVGANFEGRPGGWVGSAGYRQYTTYTGTAGGKKCYITGMQYEYKTHPTPFTSGTRSTTQGLLPLVGSTSINLNSVSFDSTAQMVFDGTDDNISLDTSVGNLGTADWTISCWWKSNGTQDDYASIISQGFIYPISAGGWSFKVKNASGENFLSFSYATAGEAITNLVTSAACNDGNWHNLVAVRSGGTVTLYMDGVSVGSTSPGASYSFGTGATTYVGYTPRDAAYVNGYLNTLTKYSRALAPSEVQTNYTVLRKRFNV